MMRAGAGLGCPGRRVAHPDESLMPWPSPNTIDSRVCPPRMAVIPSQAEGLTVFDTPVRTPVLGMGQRLSRLGPEALHLELELNQGNA